MTLSGDHYRALVSGERRGLGAAVQRLGLWAVSLPYGWAVRVRNRLYDAGWKRSRRVSVPVVSIGNLTLGGTGKTPFVEYVAGFYRKQGRRVAILSLPDGFRFGHVALRLYRYQFRHSTPSETQVQFPTCAGL